MTPVLLLAAALAQCSVTDGDTLRCGPAGQARQDERVRLIGIDAPELPGHCHTGRRCAPGDGFASTRSLESLIAGRTVRIERHGFDHYGRTLAFVFVGPVNLSCAQLQAGQAIYVERWDIGGTIARCR